MLKKRVGQLILEAGIIGDIFEILAIIILGIIIRAQTYKTLDFFTFLLEFFVFLIIILLMRYFIIVLLLKIPKKDGKKYDYFTIAFLVLMIMALASEILNFSVIIGSLLAGLLLKDKLVEDKLYFEEHQIIEALEIFNRGIFEPIVFISIGLAMNLDVLLNNISFGIVLTVFATIGKILGSILGNKFCNEPINEGFLIGWGLNARGATELFALLIARNFGFINQDVFSAVVFMAFFTTLVSPIVFKYLVMKNIGIVRHLHKKKIHLTLKRRLS